MNLVIDANVWVSAAVKFELNHPISLAFIQRKHIAAGAVFCPNIVLAECASAIIRPVSEEKRHDAQRLADEFTGADRTIS